MRNAPIGVLDSGMGGLGVLHALRRALPHERFLYFGDNANAPYGPRPPEEIRALTLRTARVLMERGVKALVVACNTANSAAGELLRKRLPIPVVGVEPDLEDARACAGGRRVVVFATQATLALPLYQGMRERLCPDAVSIPAPELVLMVERGVCSGAEPEAFFREKLRPWPREEIGAFVMGCTHFIFLRDALSAVAPGIPIFDGVEPVVASLRDTLARADALAVSGAGEAELLTSSHDPEVRARMRALLAVELP